MQQHDASLVEQLLAGDKAAFGPLVERHQPGALRLARRLLSDPADAADVTQEAFLVGAEVFAHASLAPERVRSEAEAQYQSFTLTGANPEMALQSFRALQSYSAACG